MSIKSELLKEYINKSEMLCSLSCRIDHLLQELNYDGFGYSKLDREAIKASIRFKKNRFKDKSLELLPKDFLALVKQNDSLLFGFFNMEELLWQWWDS